MKVFAHPPRENWIIDRIVEEWNRDNHDISTTDYRNADVIWLAADFCWRHLPYDVLKSKKVVATIHHIVDEKFDHEAQRDFFFRDEITDVYHVPNDYTKSFITKFTKKPIEAIPYWGNTKLWFRSSRSSEDIRKQYGLPEHTQIISSFQRDTEGNGCDGDNPIPKLEKGPDLLADALEKWKNMGCQFHVLLAGWRRQYLIKRLQASGISFSYMEKPTVSVLRDLYQVTDLYPVTSRCEGGPQSLIECGLMGVKVVSRPVGIAHEVLSAQAIHTDVTLAEAEIPHVDHLATPEGYRKYRELFERLANG